MTSELREMNLYDFVKQVAEAYKSNENIDEFYIDEFSIDTIYDRVCNELEEQLSGCGRCNQMPCGPENNVDLYDTGDYNTYCVSCLIAIDWETDETWEQRREARVRNILSVLSEYFESWKFCLNDHEKEKAYINVNEAYERFGRHVKIVLNRDKRDDTHCCDRCGYNRCSEGDRVYNSRRYDYLCECCRYR
jgi:hypothetical protein